MAIDLDVVKRAPAESVAVWSSKDALLYALGVGAGQGSPEEEITWTTENSIGVPQTAIPTFGAVLVRSQGPDIDIGSFNKELRLHGEQSVTAHADLPTEGVGTVRTKVSHIFDQGSGALVVYDAELTVDGRTLLESQTSIFLRGEGGFGGARKPKQDLQAPSREPDEIVRTEIPVNQALIYRLSGDSNPLHSDPVYARRGGFDRPILHGMCTYGYACRLLINHFCAGRSDRFVHIGVRFTKPVFPGDRLELRCWDMGSAEDGIRETYFTVSRNGDEVALDRGSFRWRD